MAQDAYVTMLFTDDYLQGAQVLAASLRDGGTTKKLAVIVPADEAHRLLPLTISQLEQSFDYVIPMPTLASTNHANLRILERPDLALTLTKINLWRLVQFRKCVYVDADILALRAPDELFDLDVEFAAAPDVGWPDIFNSGVFLFKPSLSTYYALKTLAESGITFDGGDQGLLNTFFPAYHRLSFTYNVTPSAGYQYLPAYRHFASNITFFHFIGRSKPWYRPTFGGGDTFNDATGRWWSVYEKHFGWKIREEELRRNQESALRTRAMERREVAPPPPVETYTRHEQPPPPPVHVQTQPFHPPHQHPSHPRYPPVLRTEDRPRSSDGSKQVSFGETAVTYFRESEPAPEVTSTPTYHTPTPPPQESYPPPHEAFPQAIPAPPPPEQPRPPPFEPAMVTWDPARSAPPPDAGPEARNLSIATYESAWDRPYDPHEPAWVPPPRSPLPKGYEYTPPHLPATREIPEISSESEEEEASEESHTDDSESPEGRKEAERFQPIFPWEMRGQRPAAARVFPGDQPPEKEVSKAVVPPPRPYDRRASLEKYEFTNAWDSLPIIQSYVKQKLGETPEPIKTEEGAEIETSSASAPTASVPRDVLAVSSVASATEGERWDPNKQLDKLKSGVMSRLREQQQQKRSAAEQQPSSSTQAEEHPPVSIDDGTNP